MAEGIRDYDQKFGAIMAILGFQTMKQVADAAVKGVTDKGLQCTDPSSTISKWKTSKPTKPESVLMLKRIMHLIGLPEDDWNFFKNCVFEDFYARLPDPIKGKLEIADGPPIKKYHGKGFHIIHRHISMNPLEFDSGILSNSSVHQMQMYQTKESWKLWKRMRESSDYTSYRQCSASLSKILKTKSFSKLFSDSNFSLACFFGVGSPDKEAEVARFLDKHASVQRSASNLLFFDASYYMLINSHNATMEVINEEKLNVIIESYQLDFTRMGLDTEQIRDGFPESRCLFLITGGTFGNNKESEFLTFLKKMSRKNDIIVITVEFYNPAIKDEYLNHLLNTYDENTVKDLVLCSVRTFLDENGISKIQDERRKMLKTDRMGGPTVSNIKETIGVELYMEVGRKRFSLALSKRYNYEYFMSYVEQFGFERVLLDDCQSEPNFGTMTQMIFRVK